MREQTQTKQWSYNMTNFYDSFPYMLITAACLVLLPMFTIEVLSATLQTILTVTCIISTLVLVIAMIKSFIGS